MDFKSQDYKEYVISIENMPDGLDLREVEMYKALFRCMCVCVCACVFLIESVSHNPKFQMFVRT